MSGGSMADPSGALPPDGVPEAEESSGRGGFEPGVSPDGTWRPLHAGVPPQAEPVPPAAPSFEEPSPFAVPFPAVPAPEPTGEERVDAALGRLAELSGAPVSGHVEIFQEVHHRLQAVLTSVDQEAAGPPVPRPPGPGVVPPRHGGRP